jgi:hypothetical protein
MIDRRRGKRKKKQEEEQQEAPAEDGFIVLFYSRFVSWEQSIRV